MGLSIKTSKKLRFSFVLFPAFFLIFHYIINQDYRLVNYDPEPDYIFNALHILKYKIPVGTLHPGTISYYIISVLLKFSELFELSFSHTIVFIRSVLIFNLLFLTALLFNNSIAKFNYYLFLILIIPRLDFMLGLIGPDILLFCVSILILRLIKEKNENYYSIGIIIAIGLSIKLNFILLLPVILLYLFAKKKNAVYYFKILTTSIISFIILTLPVLPNFFSYYRHLILSNDLMLDGHYIFPILFVFLLSLSVIVLIKNKIVIHYFLINIIKRHQITSFIYSIILIAPAIILTVISDYIIIRHVVPLIPVIVECGFKTKIKFHKRIEYVIHILLVISILLLNRQKINYHEHTEFDQFVNDNNDKLILVLQDNYFYSEYLFREWGQFRYANSEMLWSKKWKTKYNLEFFNTRNQKCLKNVNWAGMSTFNKWYLDHKNNYTQYYSPCIIDQIKKIEKGEAILATFNHLSDPHEDQINKIKPILLKFGFKMYPKIKFNNFIIWGIQNSSLPLKYHKIDGYGHVPINKTLNL